MSENERLRAIQFMRSLDNATCERRERFPGGVATLSDRELPCVLNMNLLRVESLVERLSVRELSGEAERIAGEAERLQSRLGFRRVVAYDEEIGARLALGFEQLERWRSERVVLMAQHRPADRDVDASFVRELGAEELEPVRARYLLARSGGDEELARQQLEVARRLADAGELRFFAAVVDGSIASFCELYADESGTAVVRSVATLERYRLAGLARATVSSAVARSRVLGHDLTFLRAVHDDWPKNLYGKLGFDAIGMIYRFAGTPAWRQPGFTWPAQDGVPRLHHDRYGDQGQRPAGQRDANHIAEEVDQRRGADHDGHGDESEDVRAGGVTQQQSEREREEHGRWEEERARVQDLHDPSAVGWTVDKPVEGSESNDRHYGEGENEGYEVSHASYSEPFAASAHGELDANNSVAQPAAAGGRH
ncbi:MAG: GNAT family N-acetyltransferase [Gaiellaceae bacterium]